MKKILILFLVASYHSSAQNSLEKIPKPFELLIGEWYGYEIRNGVEILVDSVSFSSAISANFLKLYLVDKRLGFKIEGYFFHKGGKYEFHEFNNGRWPVRHFYGSFKGNKLNLLEKTKDREVLLEIIFISDRALQIIETSIRGKEAAGSVIVNEKLKRIE